MPFVTSSDALVTSGSLLLVQSGNGLCNARAGYDCEAGSQILEGGARRGESMEWQLLPFFYSPLLSLNIF